MTENIDSTEPTVSNRGTGAERGAWILFGLSVLIAFIATASVNQSYKPNLAAAGLASLAFQVALPCLVAGLVLSGVRQLLARR